MTLVIKAPAASADAASEVAAVAAITGGGDMNSDGHSIGLRFMAVLFVVVSLR